MSTIKLIKLANKLERKYPIKKVAELTGQQVGEIIRNAALNGQFPNIKGKNFIEALKTDNLNARLKVSYEEGILTWVLGSKLIVSNFSFQENTPKETQEIYNRIIPYIQAFLRKHADFKVGEGPWIVDFP